MKIKYYILTIAIALSVFFTGCTTIGSGPDLGRIQKAAKLAAYIGATEYMRAYPVSRPGFVLAQTELAELAKSDGLDMAKLLAIVNRLPVKNINNERVQMYITSTAIILSEFGDKLPLDRLAELQPVAQAIADGLALALGQQ